MRRNIGIYPGILPAAILSLSVSLFLAAQEGKSEPQQERAERQAAEKSGKQLGEMFEAQKGKDIDAGLSWRVALLPYPEYRSLIHHPAYSTTCFR